jgi:hypothetical protein
LRLEDLVVPALAVPRVAEEAEGGHGRQAEQHVAAVELLLRRSVLALAGRGAVVLLVVGGHRSSYFAGRPNTSTST